MKPAPFEYHAPEAVEEALALLDALRDEDAKVLAGGQSLMPLLNMRLARPSHVVDINGLRALDYVAPRGEDGLAVGALTRYRTLERSAAVASGLPLLAEALPLIGDRQIRCRGTAGGSLAHADPAAELPLVAGALDATLTLASVAGTRTVAAGEFFLTVLTTALEPHELLTEVCFRVPRPGAGQAFVELARQHGAFAIVAVAAVLTLDDGRIDEARLCLGGVGPTPLRATRAEERLRGERPGAALFAEAARLAAEDTEPSADVHGDEAYRREMAAVYTRRALAVAAARAGAGPREGG
ncbi:MAG TPA: FAD binding domain-containing protein [Chloroflexota bacterium]|jgi:carbon-monoxide dehydrogenase medium subunit